MKHPSSETGPAYTTPKGPGYETTDLSVSAIVKFGIGFAIFITAAQLIMVVMFFVLKQEQPGPIAPLSPPSVQVRPPVAGPRLEVSPTANWDEMQDAQERLLTTYGWVNPDAGIVRLPIVRAMELAIERGFPVRDTKAQKAEMK